MSKNQTIADRAITYQMSVAAFNPTKKVKDVQVKASEAYGCDADVFTGTIYMIDPDFTQPLTEKVRQIRRFFDDNTLKLGLISIIPSNNYWRVADFVQNEIPKFDGLANDFVTRWEGEIRPKSLTRLKKLGMVGQVANAPVWKMGKPEVTARIYFEFSKGTLSSPSQLKNIAGLPEDLRKSFEADIRQELDELEVKAHQEIAQRLVKVLRDFTTKFRGLKENSRVYDSITGNIGTLADLVPSLIVKDDPLLVELAAEAKKLAAWDVEVLKENLDAREEALTTADSILSRMSF